MPRRFSPMTSDVKRSYLNWLKYTVLKNDIYDSHRYSDLLDYLHSVCYFYTSNTPLDDNRRVDAILFRSQFTKDELILNQLVFDDPEEVSVLEFMISFSVRTFEAVMYGHDYEELYTSSNIFWMMIENLGFEYQTNENFNESFVEKTIQSMMAHDVDSHGFGGLFRIRNLEPVGGRPRNMSNTEHWMQMQWWAAELYDEYFKTNHAATLLKGASGCA